MVIFYSLTIQNERHFNGVAARDRQSKANLKCYVAVFIKEDIDCGQRGMLRAASTVRLGTSATLTAAKNRMSQQLTKTNRQHIFNEQ